MDCGDYVVVTNCLDVKVTGRKEEQLVYRKHTMFPGGLKEMPYRDMMIKKPEEARLHPSIFVPLLWTNISAQIIKHAVSGMLPKNKLRDRRMERLRIFPSSETGILGANVLRSFEDGTLTEDYEPNKDVKRRIMPKSLVDSVSDMWKTEEKKKKRKY